MREIERNGNKYRLSGSLSRFQEDMHVHLIDWKRRHITTEAGTHRSKYYDAILPQEVREQLPHLYGPIRDAFRVHQRDFPFRRHPHFFHMASSQAACANLFLPILTDPDANNVLRTLKPGFDRVATDQLDRGFRIEFWDEPMGRLRDKTPAAGTDSDIAIAYYDQEERLCLWLIEHKLTEQEFTTCGGARSRGRTDRHTCDLSFAELVEDSSRCYYHDPCGYAYWEITRKHADRFSGPTPDPGCPFRGGMNQLWRNHLLTMAIEDDPEQPFEQVSFSVVHHPHNPALRRSIVQYSELTRSSPGVGMFTSQDFIEAVDHASDAGSTLQDWARWYAELYRL